MIHQPWTDEYIKVIADELTNALTYTRDRAKQEAAIAVTLRQVRDETRTQFIAELNARVTAIEKRLDDMEGD